MKKYIHLLQINNNNKITKAVYMAPIRLTQNSIKLWNRSAFFGQTKSVSCLLHSITMQHHMDFHDRNT